MAVGNTIHGLSIQFGLKGGGVLGLTGSLQSMDYSIEGTFEEYLDGNGTIVTTAGFGQKEMSSYTYYCGDGTSGGNNAVVSAPTLYTLGTVTNTSGAGAILSGSTWQCIGFGLKGTNKSPHEGNIKLVRHAAITS